MKDHNTSDYWDPHQCTNSCQDPGYGCLACTNPNYFQCKKNNQSVCIHPDLHCNQHPDCDNAEDENYEDCKDRYEFATLRCSSKIYPKMETMATVCDDIIECHNGEDEPESCKNNEANKYLAVSVCSILAIYLGLKSYFHIMKNKQKISNQKKNIVLLKLNTRLSNYTEMTVFRQKINCLCLHIKNYYDQEAKVKIGLKIFALEENFTRNMSMVFASLHNNYLPEVANMVIDARYPGFVVRHLNFINLISGFLKRFERIHSARHLVGKLAILFAQYSDIFKDIYLLSILIQINGGLRTLYQFPWKFSSIIIICLTTTIVGPLLISSIQLAISNPGLIFNSRRKDKWSVRLMRVGVILTCFINPIILKVANENIQEKIRKYSQTTDPSEKLIQLVNKKKELKNQLSRLLKVDLGLELIYQIALQLILVLLSISKTPTTSGLEAFFEQTNNALLVFLTCWSFKTCVLLHKSAIKTEKVFFPFTSQLVITFLHTVAAGRRIMAIVVFFLPSLGLFSILNHWKAEQLQFRIRILYSELRSMTPNDIIALNNMSRNVTWTSIDRWDYTNHDKPQPPPYSLYTGLSLGHTFKVFLILMVLHLIAITVVKVNTVKKTKKESWFNFLVHVIENMNIPYPYKDWDIEDLTVAEFKQKLRGVNIEMAWTYVVNFIIHILMFCPFWWTGKKAYLLI